MLKKIVAIKNVGRFRNSGAPGNPQLAKHTFVLAPNGYGKTTTCAVLRSLKTGDASHILGRKTLGVAAAPTVDLLFDDAPCRFDGTAWSALRPAISIFDGVFVAENIHSGEVVEIDHKRNLYRVIIGEDGVTLAETDAALAAASRALTSDITASGRALLTHVSGGMQLDTFIALPIAPDIDVQIVNQERTVAAVREASTLRQRASLTEFPLYPLPTTFRALLAKTIEDIAQDSEEKLAEHLAAHDMRSDGADWIAIGMDHLKGDACPFCGQSVGGLPLIAAFRSVFSDQYSQLKDEIADMQAQIDRVFGDGPIGRLATLAEQNKSATEF